MLPLRPMNAVFSAAAIQAPPLTASQSLTNARILQVNQLSFIDFFSVSVVRTVLLFNITSYLCVCVCVCVCVRVCFLFFLG